MSHEQLTERRVSKARASSDKRLASKSCQLVECLRSLIVRLRSELADFESEEELWNNRLAATLRTLDSNGVFGSSSEKYPEVPGLRSQQIEQSRISQGLQSEASLPSKRRFSHKRLKKKQYQIRLARKKLELIREMKNDTENQISRANAEMNVLIGSSSGTDSVYETQDPADDSPHPERTQSSLFAINQPLSLSSSSSVRNSWPVYTVDLVSQSTQIQPPNPKHELSSDMRDFLESEPELLASYSEKHLPRFYSNDTVASDCEVSRSDSEFDSQSLAFEGHPMTEEEILNHVYSHELFRIGNIDNLATSKTVHYPYHLIQTNDLPEPDFQLRPTGRDQFFHSSRRAHRSLGSRHFQRFGTEDIQRHRDRNVDGLRLSEGKWPRAGRLQSPSDNYQETTRTVDDYKPTWDPDAAVKARFKSLQDRDTSLKLRRSYSLNAVTTVSKFAASGPND